MISFHLDALCILADIFIHGYALFGIAFNSHHFETKWIDVFEVNLDT
jgi:hypothetical protein